MIRGEIRHPGPQIAPAEPAADDDAGFGALFRVGLWGGTAAACLLAVALATRTETGQSRLASAYGTGGSAEVSSGPHSPRDSDVEARRMAETIRNLSEDRDRLLVRMTALERNYEDVTGSIGKLAKAGRPPAAAVPQPPAPATDAEPPVASVPIQAPATVAPAAAEPEPLAKPAAMPPPAKKPAAVAATPAAPEPAEPLSARTEFGVDIGGGPNLTALRGSWDRIRRNHASLLTGLRPVISVRDRAGGGVELRLIVGPIPNAAAAARLCASLATAGLSCQPTMFEGQRLALN